MPKTFVTGDPLPASDLNTNMVQPATGTVGTRIMRGITAVTFSTQASVDITITYGFTFSAAPTVVGTVHVGSSFNLAVLWNTAPGTTSVSAHVFQVAGTNISGTANIHWIAIGAA